MVSTQTHYQLRPLEERDLDLVLQWRNSEKILSVSYSRHLISQEEHQNWFASLKTDSTKCSLIFEINRKPVGVVNFFFIDPTHQQCTWGFYLGADDLPKGTGTEMGRLAMNFAFEELRLRQVKAEALLSNETSVKFHKKLGFKSESEFSKKLNDGESARVMAFSLTKEDWQVRKQDLR
jgi:UDP-4-amino-4,6-dideoxy-N-acetyl-beta-L-altrosamine N-acetyltransferase